MHAYTALYNYILILLRLHARHTKYIYTFSTMIEYTAVPLLHSTAIKYTYLSREFSQDMSCACATVVAEWWWYPAQLVKVV